MTPAELSELAAELGLDVVGAAPAQAYRTEQHIRERRDRGLFATWASRWLDRTSHVTRSACSTARGRLWPSALLRGPPAGPGPNDARLPRYTWRDEYAVLRERLDALGGRLGGAYRVLVDERSRRPGSRRACRGGLLRQEHDGDHPKPRILGRPRSARHRRRDRREPAARLDCGDCGSASTPARRRSTSPALSTQRSVSRTGPRPAPIPEAYRDELGDSVYGCDICQEVCPWNRGIEKRRRGSRLDGAPAPRLASGLARARREDLAAAFDRCTSRETTVAGYAGTR